MKLESRNLGEMTRDYELAEALSDMVWHDFDNRRKSSETLGFLVRLKQLFVFFNMLTLNTWHLTRFILPES